MSKIKTSIIGEMIWEKCYNYVCKNLLRHAFTWHTSWNLCFNSQWSKHFHDRCLVIRLICWINGSVLPTSFHRMRIFDGIIYCKFGMCNFCWEYDMGVICWNICYKLELEFGVICWKDIRSFCYKSDNGLFVSEFIVKIIGNYLWCNF